MSRKVRVFDLVIAVSIWAGGFFGTSQFTGKLLHPGTPTGFSFGEEVVDNRPRLALRLRELGRTQARVNVLVSRALPGGDVYSAHFERSRTPLTVSSTLSASGRWLEIRGTQTDSLGGLFWWPPDEALILDAPGGISVPFQVRDWRVVLNDRPADTMQQDTRRRHVDMGVGGVWALAAVAGIATVIRSARKDSSSGEILRVFPGPDDVTPDAVMGLLAATVLGIDAQDTRRLQRFISRRLAGHTYEELDQELQAEGTERQIRTVPFRARKSFTERLDTYVAEFQAARQRFPEP